MGFIKRHKGRANYDLLSNYSHYLPGFGGMMMMLLLFGIGAVIGILVLLPFTLMYPESAMTYGNIISYPLMFVPPMIYASVQSRRANIFESGYALDSKHFGQRGGFWMAVIVSVATLAAAFAAEPLSAWLPPMPEHLEQALSAMLDGPLWVSFLSVSVFAPFFEEWLCRGIVLRGLLQKSSPAVAITVSAAFFAILHMNPWQAIPAFLLGLLFGYVYYKTGSLKLTMLMHFVNNTFALMISKVPSLADVENFMEVLCPWKYTCIYIAAVLFLVSTVVILAGIPKKEGAKSNCDEIPPMDI